MYTTEHIMNMSAFFQSDRERRVAEATARLAYCNPFLEDRLDLEREVLGDEYTPFFAVWHPREGVVDDNPNVVAIAERGETLVGTLRRRIEEGVEPTADERESYRGLCLYILYYRYQRRLYEMVRDADEFDGGRHAPFWPEFRKDFAYLLEHPQVLMADPMNARHVFACFYQLRRAFRFTFRSITGASMPSARLRSRVWQSIFSHDLKRYQRALYERMGVVSTLITGPSGAGKELVARAIGLARYIPFDPKTRRFRESFESSFFALNLSALSPTLIESELFGHRRGSFTGATADRKGWLEVCPPLGTVFLDEIGDLDPAIQIKLLRVLETRTFQPLGTTEERHFEGKIVTATNRDLACELREGRFREDLYFRLCADTVTTPSLRERLNDSNEELPSLLMTLARRLAGDEEAPALAEEAESWIREHLADDYAWPGNVRELSQCLSNVLIHRDYQPLSAHTGPDRGPGEALAASILEGSLTADELLRGYCTLVYRRTGSYTKTAELLHLDRRTVKAKVNIHAQ